MNLISAENLNLTEYSDILVYRIIERIIVLSKEEFASDSLEDLKSPATYRNFEKEGSVLKKIFFFSNERVSFLSTLPRLSLDASRVQGFSFYFES